jgi:hypothetical protein
MRKRNTASNDRGSRLERLVVDKLFELRAKLDDCVQVVPQHPVVLTSGRKSIIDFRLTIHFSHETQNYYIEVQSRRKHDHELIDKIEAVRRDTQLKTFRFVHDTELEESVANELQARGVICYDLPGFDTFLKGIELNLTAVARLQAQVERGDTSVDQELKELVKEIATADKDIAHMNPVHNPERDKKVRKALELAAQNPEALTRLIKNFLNR